MSDTATQPTPEPRPTLKEAWDEVYDIMFRIRGNSFGSVMEAHGVDRDDFTLSLIHI